MSKKQRMTNKLITLNTFNMQLNQCYDLAKSVFYIQNLPELIDFSYIADLKIKKGSVAFFFDEELNQLLALPWNYVGEKMFNDMPNKIQCYGSNGYLSEVLKPYQYVIMWDNISHRSIANDLYLYAQRLAQIQRTIDINVEHQKTPRIFYCDKNDKLSVEDALNAIDEYGHTIITYKGFNNLEDSTVLKPVPYVANDLKETSTFIWNQFLRFIGVSSLDVEKKERLLGAEVEASQGGSSLFLNWRGLALEQAVNEINEKFIFALEKPLKIQDFSDYILQSLFTTNQIKGGIKDVTE